MRLTHILQPWSPLLLALLLSVGACGGGQDLPDGGRAQADLSGSAGPSCGNGVCEANESQSNCCADCKCNGNATCTPTGCQGPTGGTCGNGVCEASESQSNCCADCKCSGTATCTATGCRAPAGPVCGNNACELGESQSNCCSDCGCPAGYACDGQTCKSTCGNGTCDAGESQASCCQDCGCQDSYACQANRCVFTGMSTLSWTVTNNCLNGENISFRYFSETRNWVWPSANQVFISTPGSNNTNRLTCNTGEKVCFGGRQPNHGYYWGVDWDHSKSCANCCFTCATQPVNSGTLICP